MPEQNGALSFFEGCMQTLAFEDFVGVGFEV